MILCKVFGNDVSRVPDAVGHAVVVRRAPVREHQQTDEDAKHGEDSLPWVFCADEHLYRDDEQLAERLGRANEQTVILLRIACGCEFLVGDNNTSLVDPWLIIMLS